MTKYILAPSIVSADHLRLKDEIALCEANGANWFHVDVMDGHFAPNITFGPFLVETYKRATKLPLDVHLMIEKPERYISAFAKAGADILTVHVEACADINTIVDQIKSVGCKAGVAINPETPISSVETIFPIVDLVLVMSVRPGFSGQVFMPETVSKVVEARKRLDEINSQAYLEVDGGISTKTLHLMKNAGANVFVAASAIFNHSAGTEAGLKEMRTAVLA